MVFGDIQSECGRNDIHTYIHAYTHTHTHTHSHCSALPAVQGTLGNTAGDGILWPVFLTILNLPASIRMKAENVLLCGLWYGPTKPPISGLLDPVLNNIQRLTTVGMSMMTPAGLRTVRAKLVMGIFDLPAKAAVLCARQFNGLHGCAVCIHPGQRLSNGAWIYLPQKYADRTHQRVIKAATSAEENNCIVEGVKGVSPLTPYMDLVVSIPIDYMHAVLEGVVRLLMNSWFTSSHHREPQYLGRAAASIISHLTKYVRLWGPLWTHSSFGYESKNGHIKQFIHNKSNVVRQLLFNVDVSITLQHLYPVLRETETHETLNFLSAVGHTEVRHNMHELQPYVYAVGKHYPTVLAGNEADALGLEPGTVVEAFTRLYKDGVLYHSQAYSRSEGKRNNTICVYSEPHGYTVHFGHLKLFIGYPEQCALVVRVNTSDYSLMQRAGPALDWILHCLLIAIESTSINVFISSAIAVK